MTLKSLSDLQKLKELAQDRDAWKKFVNDIYKVAEKMRNHIAITVPSSRNSCE